MTAGREPTKAVELLACGMPALLVLQIWVALWSANARELVASRAGSVVLALLLATTWWTLHRFRSNAVGEVSWRLLAGYCAFLLARDLMISAPFGVLTGHEGTATSTLRPRLVLLETCVLMSALFAGLRVPRRVLANVAALLSLTSLAITLPPAIRLATGDAPGLRAPVVMGNADRRTDASLPDVFHIVLDEYQTTYFEALQEEIDWLDGFVWFPNTVSNYNTTSMSLASLLTGELYDSTSDIREWEVAYETRGLLPRLKSRGYRVHVYNGCHVFDWNSPHVDHVRHSAAIANDHFRVENGTLLPRLLGLRLLPYSLGNRMISLRTGDRPREFDFAYFSAEMFADALEQIRDNPSGGNYYFIHLLLPHPPTVLSRDGEYVGPDRGTLVDQVRFAHALVRRLLALLRSTNRLEHSVVLIHGDHGSYVDIAATNQPADGEDFPAGATMLDMNRDADVWRDGSKLPIALVKARTRPLLLAKPVGSRPFTTRDLPMELRRIPDLVFASIDDAEEVVAGAALASPERFVHILGMRVGEGRVPHFQQYLVTSTANTYTRGRQLQIRGTTRF